MKPLKPIIEYELTDLLGEVKERFGSIHNFNLTVGRQEFDLYYLQAGVSEKKRAIIMKSIYGDILEYEPESIELNNRDRALIRSRIYTKAKNIVAFCRTYPDYTNQYISRVLNGVFTKITPKIKNLLTLLDIK